MLSKQNSSKASKYLKKVIKILLDKDFPPHDIDELLQIIVLIMGERERELEEECSRKQDDLKSVVDDLRIKRVEIQEKINSLRWRIEELEDDKYLIDSSIMKINLVGVKGK